MKYLASLFSLIAILTLSPQAAFADSTTTINLSNNGENSQNDVTVNSNTGGMNCVNGNCTTPSSTDQVTSCINGQCQTSDNGNLHMQSSDGNDQVTVNDAAPTISVTMVPSPTQAGITISPSASVAISVSPVVSTTPSAQIHHLKKQIRKQIEELKEHMKDQNATLSSLMQSLQDLLNGLFK